MKKRKVVNVASVRTKKGFECEEGRVKKGEVKGVEERKRRW
jgi:hypothetical protein